MGSEVVEFKVGKYGSPNARKGSFGDENCGSSGSLIWDVFGLIISVIYYLAITCWIIALCSDFHTSNHQWNKTVTRRIISQSHPSVNDALIFTEDTSSKMLKTFKKFFKTWFSPKKKKKKK